MRRSLEAAELVSLNIGMPVAVAHGAKEVMTGIYKQASNSVHSLSFTGIEGDGQGDTVHHGGPDKAICAYFAERYAYWRDLYSLPFEYGAFGENFTLSDWTEDDLCIGDIIESGGTLLQVVQPRQPCYKLGLRHQLPDLPVQVQNQGFTGFYFRVLREGQVQKGTELKLVHRHPAGKTITEANRLMYIDQKDRQGLRELLTVEELAESWRTKLGKRLERLEQDS